MTRKTFYRHLKNLTEKTKTEWTFKPIEYSQGNALMCTIRTKESKCSDRTCPIVFVYNETIAKPNNLDKLESTDVWEAGHELGLSDKDVGDIIAAADYTSEKYSAPISALCRYNKQVRQSLLSATNAKEAKESAGEDKG